MFLRYMLLGIFCPLKFLFSGVEPFEVAEERALAEGKPLMIFFLGNGWCHWCDELEKQILVKHDFLKNVEKDFILIQVNFPRSVGKQKNENTYKKRFNVGRYPTLVIYDPKTEKVFQESGYREMSAKEYAFRLKEIFLDLSKNPLHAVRKNSLQNEPASQKMLSDAIEQESEDGLFVWIPRNDSSPIFGTKPRVRVGFGGSWWKDEF